MTTENTSFTIALIILFAARRPFRMREDTLPKKLPLLGNDAESAVEKLEVFLALPGNAALAKEAEQREKDLQSQELVGVKLENIYSLAIQFTVDHNQRSLTRAQAVIATLSVEQMESVLVAGLAATDPLLQELQTTIDSRGWRVAGFSRSTRGKNAGSVRVDCSIQDLGNIATWMVGKGMNFAGTGASEQPMFAIGIFQPSASAE